MNILSYIFLAIIIGFVLYIYMRKQPHPLPLRESYSNYGPVNGEMQSPNNRFNYYVSPNGDNRFQYNQCHGIGERECLSNPGCDWKIDAEGSGDCYPNVYRNPMYMGIYDWYYRYFSPYRWWFTYDYWYPYPKYTLSNQYGKRKKMIKNMTKQKNKKKHKR